MYELPRCLVFFPFHACALHHSCRSLDPPLFLGKMMGTNQNGKRFYQVKVKGLDFTSLKELGQLMGPLQRQAFRKVYGKILDLAAAEVFT